MALSRFRTLLIGDETLNKLSNEDAGIHDENSMSESHQEEIVREFADDPTPDAEVIAEIETAYFGESGFDASNYELQKLPDELNEEHLDKYRNKLRRQLQAVSRQLSKKILENHNSYVRELGRVIDLQSSLQSATHICSTGRSQLQNAKEEISLGGLQILAKHRRKTLLVNLLKSLRFIKTLQRTDVRLKELLEENNYASAIQLCLECQEAVVTFKQYTCISELSSNLKDVLEQIEEHLDGALSKMCQNFSEVQYSKIVQAYQLLGKSKSAIDQLQMHYVSTINSTAVETVAEILQERKKAYGEMSFDLLCQHVAEDFTPCLILLCKRFWRIMYSYYCTSKWHAGHQAVLEPKPSSLLTDDAPANVHADCGADITASFEREYIRTKLEQGLTRIWQDIQKKVKIYVSASNFASFKYDDFIKVLNIVNRLISVGEEFCGSKSQDLQDCIREQTANYFKAYHRSTLDELRMFLENEIWELCPVKANFKILDMPELKYLCSRFEFRKPHHGTESSPDTVEAGYFKTFGESQNPFDRQDDGIQTVIGRSLQRLRSEESEDDDEDDIPDELKRDFVDENTGEIVSEVSPQKIKNTTGKAGQATARQPIVTNTTLNVLRSFGKYMQMMTVLKPIAFDVLLCMSQLFDYYLYSVYTFFSRKNNADQDPDPFANPELSNKMRMTLKRIQSNIILNDDGGAEHGVKVCVPSLSPIVNLEDPATLFGLPQRLTGVESIILLSAQLHLVQSSLDSWIPQNKRAFLGQFFSQTVDVVPELRAPVYKVVAEKALNYELAFQQMSSVKWDIKEIMSQHSSYVDTLVQEYESFASRLHAHASLVPVPSEAAAVLWANIVQLTCAKFVDGFSNVKRCSNEGRALMQLDFQQYLMKIDRLVPVKPYPGREFVENYIKAYYLSESELERWIKEHSEYSSKQLKSLVTCGTGSHIGKKVKQRMLGLLDDIDKPVFR